MTAKSLGDEDRALLQILVRRHLETAKMTGRAVAHSQSLAVRRLAAAIQTTQRSEADIVAKWLTEADARVDPVSKIDPDRHSESFKQTSGDEYDRLFLAAMIAHHQETIHLVVTVISDECDPQVRDFARDLVESRNQQIDTMRELLFR